MVPIISVIIFFGTRFSHFDPKFFHQRVKVGFCFWQMGPFNVIDFRDWHGWISPEGGLDAFVDPVNIVLPTCP